MIIAYDREYTITYDAPNKEDFDKYCSKVEEMTNRIKILNQTLKELIANQKILKEFIQENNIF